MNLTKILPFRIIHRWGVLSCDQNHASHRCPPPWNSPTRPRIQQLEFYNTISSDKLIPVGVGSHPSAFGVATASRPRPKQRKGTVPRIDNNPRIRSDMRSGF